MNSQTSLVDVNSKVLPCDFIHVFQDRKFLQASIWSKSEYIIGEEGNLGRRVVFGPLCIEYYTGDKEPILNTWKGLRLIVWNLVQREDVPSLWSRVPVSSTVHALVDMRNNDAYHMLWNKTLRNYTSLWKRQDEYQIRKITKDEYCSYHVLYAKPKSQIKSNIRYITRQMIHNKEDTHFYVLEKKATQEVLGGICTVDRAPVSQSFYVSAFTRKDIAPPQTGLWLCSYWMHESSSQGIQFANLGAVCSKGRPREWRGLTAFKMKFNPILLFIKKKVLRFTFSLG